MNRRNCVFNSYSPITESFFASLFTKKEVFAFT
jgi:hypothetical protein